MGRRSVAVGSCGSCRTRRCGKRSISQAGTRALLLITGHALLIVKGGLNQGLSQSLVLQSSGPTRRLLIAERLRRMGLLRARYPSDPLAESAELFWWTDHPLLRLVLHKMPAAQGERLKELILASGDLTLGQWAYGVAPDCRTAKAGRGFGGVRSAPAGVPGVDWGKVQRRG